MGAYSPNVNVRKRARRRSNRSRPRYSVPFGTTRVGYRSQDLTEHLSELDARGAIEDRWHFTGGSTLSNWTWKPAHDLSADGVCSSALSETAVALGDGIGLGLLGRCVTARSGDGSPVGVSIRRPVGVAAPEDGATVGVGGAAVHAATVTTSNPAVIRITLVVGVSVRSAHGRGSGMVVVDAEIGQAVASWRSLHAHRVTWRALSSHPHPECFPRLGI